MPQTVLMPLSFFKTRDQCRKAFNQQDLNALGMSMKVRQLQALVCQKDGTIVCGERRFRAAQLVGMTHLMVTIIEEDLNETQIQVFALVENLQREDLTAVEQHLGCIELKRLNPTWTNRDLAAHLHNTESSITRLLSPADCIEAVRLAFFAGKLGISQCYAISKVPHGEQAEMLAMYQAGMTRDQLEAHGRKARKGSNGEASAKAAYVKCQLPSGVRIVVSGKALSLEDAAQALVEAKKEMTRAAELGYTAKTFAAAMKDRSQKGG